MSTTAPGGLSEAYPCISIRQPWAWAILHAGKNIENRDWPTKRRGRILIHASAGMTRAEWHDCLSTFHDISAVSPFPAGLQLPQPHDLVRGALVGGVTLTDCVSEHPSPWFFGRYGFVLMDPKPLPAPIPYKGQLGFFMVPRLTLSTSTKETVSFPEGDGDG